LWSRGRHCLPDIVTVGSFLREQGCVMVAAAQPKGHADHHCRQDGPPSPQPRPCACVTKRSIGHPRAADALAGFLRASARPCECEKAESAPLKRSDSRTQP
jgi:hypothetical protein